MRSSGKFTEMFQLLYVGWRRVYFNNTDKEEYENSDNVDLEDYVDDDEEGIM